MKAVYIGQRTTSKDRLAYFWMFEGEDPETPRGYAKRLAPARVGEEWEFNMKGDAVIVGGKEAPKQTGVFAARDKITAWNAEEAVAQQRDKERKVRAQLAKRQSDIDRYLEPLRMMIRGLPPNDRYVFAHFITQRLLQS